MRWALILSFSLLCGLIWMVVDIQTNSIKKQTIDSFAKLSQLYTLQIEKNDFVYRKKE